MKDWRNLQMLEDPPDKARDIDETPATGIFGVVISAAAIPTDGSPMI